MPVQKIANLDEFKALLAKPGLVVVDFTAAWCKFAVARAMGGGCVPVNDLHVWNGLLIACLR
jgi:hypothetical protein